MFAVRGGLTGVGRVSLQVEQLHGRMGQRTGRPHGVAGEGMLASTIDTFFVVSRDHLHAFDAETGDHRADLLLETEIDSRAATADVMAMADVNGTITAFGSDPQRPLWTSQTEGRSHVFTVDGRLLLAQDGYSSAGAVVSVLDPATGRPTSTVEASCAGRTWAPVRQSHLVGPGHRRPRPRSSDRGPVRDPLERRDRQGGLDHRAHPSGRRCQLEWPARRG